MARSLIRRLSFWHFWQESEEMYWFMLLFCQKWPDPLSPRLKSPVSAKPVKTVIVGVLAVLPFPARSLIRRLSFHRFCSKWPFLLEKSTFWSKWPLFSKMGFLSISARYCSFSSLKLEIANEMSLFRVLTPSGMFRFVSFPDLLPPPRVGGPSESSQKSRKEENTEKCCFNGFATFRFLSFPY